MQTYLHMYVEYNLQYNLCNLTFIHSIPIQSLMSITDFFHRNIKY